MGGFQRRLGSLYGVVIAAVGIVGGFELLRELDFLKQVFGNDFDPTQYRALIFGLSMVYLFAPILLVFVGAAMLFGYKLDARAHGEVRQALEAREVAAAEESLTGPSPAPTDEVVAIR